MEHPADAPRLRAADGEGFACDEDYGDALTVRCPTCYSAPGSRCYIGNQPVDPHSARIIAAAEVG